MDSRLKQRLQEGQALVQAGRLEDAEQHYLGLLNEHPESSGGLLHLGNIYILQQRWEDAIQQLRAGATIDPTNRKLTTSLARALLRKGEADEAVALLEREQRDGWDAKSLLLLQQCHVKLCNWRAVEEIGGRLLELLPLDDPARQAVSDLSDDARIKIECARFDEAAQTGNVSKAIEGLKDLADRYPASASVRLKLGAVFVQAGRLAEAEENYLRVLAEHPESSGAHLHLGNIYITQQRWADAIQRLRAGATIDPNNKKLTTSLARALLNNGEEAEAIALLERNQGDGVDTLRQLRLKHHLQEGQALVQAGRLEDAEQHYLRLLDEYPQSSGALLHLGNIYILQQRWADAIQRLQAGATLDPTSKKLRISLARALLKNGEEAQAISLLEQDERDALDAQSLLLLQQCYMQVCNWPQAEVIGPRLLELLPASDPSREEAMAATEVARFHRTAQSSGFASAVAGSKDLTNRYPRLPSTSYYMVRERLTQRIIATYNDGDVLRYVQDAIESGTADAECKYWLSKFLYKKHDWDAALLSAEEALALDPQHTAARFLLAKALMRCNRLVEALEQLDLLLSADPNRFAVLQLKGDISVRLARVEDAIRLYRMALRKDPGNPLINHRLSNAQLLQGDIAGYHRLQEHRRKLESFIENNKDYPFHDWNGELQITGKLLVWSEFGLGVGQNILHMTFLNSLVALGLDVVFEVEPRLVELCQRSFPDIAVVANDAELPPGISHHTPVASLGRWFKPDLASFGLMQPYFIPDARAVEALRRKLQAAAGEGQLLVGISWTSNNPLVGDVKSIPLDQLLTALASPDLTLINLQYGDHFKSIQEAVAKTGTQLMDSGVDTTNDLDGLAALVAALDLVVCIGHTTAHVAGAVGTPNFVLLPVGPFAHWLGQGKKCIWYPASTLFRRAPIDQDWRPVLAEVRNAVGEFQADRGDGWLSTTLLPGLRPSSTRGGMLSPAELRDAVECFSAQGAYRSALELLDRIPADQLTRELQIKRADLLALIGQWEEAKTIYITHQPDEGFDVELEGKLLSVNLEMYDLDAALPLAASLAKEDPARRLTVANILHRNRRNEEALAELRSLSAELPEIDGLSTLAGTVLLEMGEFEAAEAYLGGQAAAKRLPQDYTLLGRAISGQGRHEDALAAYDRALSLSKLHPSANFWRTQERLKTGGRSLAPLPPLQGETPSASMDDVVVFFVADSTYFWRHGVVLMESIERNSPAVKCHVHVINPDPGIAEGMEIIRGLLPRLKISYSYEHVDFDGCSTDYIRTYFASVRFVRLAEVFARCPATFLCVDADCIVRQDLHAARSALGSGHVAIRMRYDDRPNLSVAAGALVLRPTAEAEVFINRVGTLIRSALEEGQAVWFLDQVVLSHAVRELGGEQTEISQLDMSYIDWFFRDDSHIWTGKGKRKSEDARYTREAAKYATALEHEAVKALMRQATESVQSQV